MKSMKLCPKKYYFFLIFLSFNYIFSQINYTYLNDVRDGKTLDRAKNTNTNVFFERIISNGFELENNPKKWKIVAITSNDIYYGILKHGQNGETLVDNFCKTDVSKVQQLFPIFENTDGVNIKAKLYYLFIHDLEQKSIRPVCDKRYKLVYDKYLMKLTEKGIQVYLDVKGFCYEDKVLNIKINCLLDPTSLEVLEQNNKITDYINPENNKSIDSKSAIKNMVNDLKIKIGN